MIDEPLFLPNRVAKYKDGVGKYEGSSIVKFGEPYQSGLPFRLKQDWSGSTQLALINTKTGSDFRLPLPSSLNRVSLALALANLVMTKLCFCNFIVMDFIVNDKL